MLDFEHLMYQEDRQYAIAKWSEAETKMESTRDLRPYTNLLRVWLRKSQLRLHRAEAGENEDR